MMIQHHGLSCLQVSSKPLLGEINVVLDPFDNSTGLKLPRTLSAEIVFASSKGKEHGNISAVQGSPFIVDMPGEYEVKGVMLDVRSAKTEKIKDHKILRLSSEGISIGFLGAIDRTLTTEELELLEGVDILALPVGGNSVLTAKQAVETIQTIEPRIVIPLCTKEEAVTTDFEPLKTFKDELGVVTTEETSKYKITRSKLPADEMLLVVLQH